MHALLVVIKYGKLLICKGVWLQCHLEFMRWLGWSFQVLCLSLMNPLNEIETSIALAGPFPREWVAPNGLLRIVIANDEAIEPVHSLTLVPGRLELSRVQAEGVVRTACALLVWPIQKGPRASPTSVYECFVELRGQRVCGCIVRISCSSDSCQNRMRL